MRGVLFVALLLGSAASADCPDVKPPVEGGVRGAPHDAFRVSIRRRDTNALITWSDGLVWEQRRETRWGHITDQEHEDVAKLVRVPELWKGLRDVAPDWSTWPWVDVMRMEDWKNHLGGPCLGDACGRLAQKVDAIVQAHFLGGAAAPSAFRRFEWYPWASDDTLDERVVLCADGELTILRPGAPLRVVHLAPDVLARFVRTIVNADFLDALRACDVETLDGGRWLAIGLDGDHLNLGVEGCRLPSLDALVKELESD